jgi:chromosome segregation ATPase
MKRSVENYFEKGYRPGSIVRVKMINFITYDDAEVFPGPRLNVVLGPNGTGKSTLTHAICLACAGKVNTVGRSGDLKQFVKIGKENSKEGAYVEIDILKQVIFKNHILIL